MSNYCLVTKLKESVNNDSLGKLGTISLKMNSLSSVHSFKIKTEKDTTITISNGEFVNLQGTAIGSSILIYGTTSADPASATTVYLPLNSDAIIYIPNKYYINHFECATNSFIVNNSLNYIGTLASNPLYLNILGILTGDFNINTIKYTFVSLLTRIGSGDLSVVSISKILDNRSNYLENIPVLENTVTSITWNSSSPINTYVFYFADKFSNVTNFEASIGLSGDISNLSYFTACSRMSFVSSNVTGSMESLIEGIYANGKISGTIEFTKNIGVILDNRPVTNFINAVFTNDGVTLVARNSSDTIAIYNGLTWIYSF